MATEQVKLDCEQTDPASTNLVQKTVSSPTVKRYISIRRY